MVLEVKGGGAIGQIGDARGKVCGVRGQVGGVRMSSRWC